MHPTAAAPVALPPDAPPPAPAVPARPPETVGAASGSRASAAPALRPVLVGGIAAAAGLVALFLVAQLALDRFPFGPAGSLRDLRITVLHCLLAAYLPAAFLWTVRAARARAAALAPFLDDPAAADAPMTPSPLLLGGAAAFGLVSAFFGPSSMEPGVMAPLDWWRPSGWSPETAWHRVLGLWIGPWGAALTLAILVASLRLSRLARRLRPLDLFDRRPLAPFVAQAMTHALLVTGVATLSATFSVDFGAAMQVVWSLTSNVALVLAGVLLPVLGVRRRIREARDAELRWSAAAVARERLLVREGEPTTGRLADAVAYATLVERVPELPFDNPALRRIALYLVIPLASWVASSVVQHLVERMLG